MTQVFQNPFRPGAGIFPPHLAGREPEIEKCTELFDQSPITRNIIVTGLRGVGKTVLLARLREIAMGMGWLWCGQDMSESASVSEETIATRLLADLALATSVIPLPANQQIPIGFADKPFSTKDARIGYTELKSIYDDTPGLVSDKLKNALSVAWLLTKTHSKFRGIIFAYDEVQTMKDHAEKDQYPLSLILEVFQSCQRKEIPLLLVLTGLPTLLPLLVATRTYSERMFETVFLKKLDRPPSREAIEKPIKKEKDALGITNESIETIINLSGGYPYFIQFICKEVYDSFIRQVEMGVQRPTVPLDEIMRKLDTDFFAGRWARLSDRQRDLLYVATRLDDCETEFSTKDIVSESIITLDKPFGSSQVSQTLEVLQERGVVYKNRHGRYSFAVPLMSDFIRRQMANHAG